jgi:hypothetical protein
MNIIVRQYQRSIILRHICHDKVTILQERRIVRRCFSGSTDGSPAYIDRWFESIKKSQEFYDKCSGDTADGRKNKSRRYFYNIDLQGRLFLEETSPKNIATSIKDEKFLNFFFSRIRCADSKEIAFLKSHDVEYDYPYVSQCGVEINYIRPAATPIVFHSLTAEEKFLLYGGNLQQKFDSKMLAISSMTGRLYHRIIHTSTTSSSGEKRKKQSSSELGYGLIRSQLAVILADKITEGNDEKFVYNDEAEIDWLPDDNEPGSWAMPHDDADCF